MSKLKIFVTVKKHIETTLHILKAKNVLQIKMQLNH